MPGPGSLSRARARGAGGALLVGMAAAGDSGVAALQRWRTSARLQCPHTREAVWQPRGVDGAVGRKWPLDTRARSRLPISCIDVQAGGVGLEGRGLAERTSGHCACLCRAERSLRRAGLSLRRAGLWDRIAVYRLAELCVGRVRRSMRQSRSPRVAGCMHWWHLVEVVLDIAGAASFMRHRIFIWPRSIYTSAVQCARCEGLPGQELMRSDK